MEGLMSRKLYIFVFLIIFSLYSQISAQHYGTSIKVSTLGVTIDGIRSFGSSLNGRLGVAFFTLTQDGGGGTDEYIYTADAKLTSVSLLADYFPFGGVFRLTGGFLINLNKAELEMTPNKSYNIGGDVYTPEKLGKLNADIDFNKFAPYLGIGFGNPMSGNFGLKFTFDVGTMYQGAPKIDLSASGLIEPSAAPDQEATIEDNINWFQWYPVINFGLTYKF
jgi:hypothetical protein